MIYGTVGLILNLTNFDNSGPSTPVIRLQSNYGEPFIPVVGDTIRDNDTLATGVVAKTEKLFNDLRIWVKGVTGSSLGTKTAIYPAVLLRVPRCRHY